jgi:hypothetical protein
MSLSELPVRHGRDFSVQEAAELLREGVYLPDYPIELLAEAWRRNYVHVLVEKHSAIELRRFIENLTGVPYGE